jgi:hypothetical protein
MLVFMAFNVISLNEFSKLPLLIYHYIDHLHRDHNITLAAFIDMHYMGHDIDDNDDKQDSQLPLKSLSQNCVQAYIFPSAPVYVEQESLSYYTPPKVFFERQRFAPTQVISCLFRPPKNTV